MPSAAEVVLSPMLTGEIVRVNAARSPNGGAAWMEGQGLTHRELDRAADRMAHALARLGVGHGDRIATWTDTALDVLPLFVAAARLGAVFAPLNARHGHAEALPVLRLASASILVADAPRLEEARVLAREAGVPRLGLLGVHPAADCDVALASGLGDPDPTPYVEPAVRETDPQVVFFTSGSTGAPKGVVLSHRANFLRTYQGVFLDDTERSVCMFPLFHMAGFTLALSAWQTGGELALVSAATPEAILGAVAARRANRLYCIPAIWQRILALPADAFDTSSLRTLDTGTSATPIELLRALKSRFPQTSLRIYYGSTEVGTASALLDPDVLRKPGSVGQAPPGAELSLSDAGEIRVRSGMLMDGYLDAPDTTAEVMRDGWFHTGDLGSLDDEGYLSIVGRMKEIIRTGGESVAPAEVEAHLAKLPGIGELAVVGLPDAEWGEIVCAVVVPGDGPPPDLEALQRHSEQELARFKKPRRLEIFDALPRTPATGQVQRTLLVEQILARDNA
jgi:acyl-CoA synthetase (AMP-forming)/AMP-acid ligase II